MIPNNEYQCPYCGITNEWDDSYYTAPSSFVEDCRNCCHPIVIEIISTHNNIIETIIRRENE